MDIKVAFKPLKTLESILTNNRDGIPMEKRCGVYKLQCSQCEANYVGQTIRNLEIRMKEHINRPGNSQFGHHLKFNNHSMDNNGAKILHNESKGGKVMDLLEELEIAKAQKTPKCCNTQISNTKFKPAFLHFI